MDTTTLTDGLRSFIQLAAIVLEAAAALIILVAAGRAVTQYVKAASRGPGCREPCPLRAVPSALASDAPFSSRLSSPSEALS